jgi:hypothetical protein
MNIKTAKAYRTTSGEALCVLTGITPIEIKAAETARLYHITTDRQNRQTVPHHNRQTKPPDCTTSQQTDKTARLYITTDRKNRHTVPRHNRQTKPTTEPRRRAEGLDPSGRLRISEKGEEKDIRSTYTLMEARTNMESARVLLYTYKQTNAFF